MTTSTVWKRVGPGVYDSADGRFTMYRIEGVYPPAWNVEWQTDEISRRVDADPENVTHFQYADCIVDGAATMRDARWFFEEAIADPSFEG